MSTSTIKSLKDLRYLGMIAAGGVITSFTSIFVKLAHVGPTVSAFYRMLFGGLILLAISLIRREQLWKGFGALKMPSLCALFFGLDLFFWHRSILSVGPGLATLLGNMQVFFVALFAIVFFRERLGWRRMVAIPLAVSGLYFVVKNGWGLHSGQFKLGVIFGLITAVSYAGYILILRESQSKKYDKEFSLMANIAVISLLTAALLGIAILFEHGEDFIIPDLQSWGALLGMGIIGQVLGWVLISKGLPNVDASAGGLALLIQPALTFLWDILIFDRSTAFIEYAGIVIVLVAIYLGSVRSNK